MYINHPVCCSVGNSLVDWLDGVVLGVSCFRIGDVFGFWFPKAQIFDWVP